MIVKAINEVILVNEKDQELGTMEKLEVHQKGLLHRAFSVFVFNDKNELLLQQRALNKYHSGGLWTNTCCSHPMPGENVVVAAKRRMVEEMGMNTSPRPLFSFIYKAELENNLIEHELDHVLIAYSNDQPQLSPEEATEFKWMPIDLIRQDMEVNPTKYTAWFKIILKEYINEFTKIRTHESL